MTDTALTTPPYHDTTTAAARACPDAAGTSDPLTERSRRIWGAGDYDRVAAGFRDDAETFVARQALGPGQRVLDAACGSGNLTIPAARTGAAVTGLDVAPSLLADAARWAAREGVHVDLDEGSASMPPSQVPSFPCWTANMSAGACVKGRLET